MDHLLSLPQTTAIVNAGEPVLQRGSPCLFAALTWTTLSSVSLPALAEGNKPRQTYRVLLADLGLEMQETHLHYQLMQCTHLYRLLHAHVGKVEPALAERALGGCVAGVVVVVFGILVVWASVQAC